ncbi:glutamate-1-semialdehyde 2,1-aminomutase [Microbacterium amylolyticum]|uniref:Glutamate-1-semialdehyde 2,1-aminomutase n=1 Tax=Microbacterium amylolyticum TaxID=936337 RepID=A0ABS4ZI02_9MICO|nr:glutamate-1-semialdehyde 2,1-aminomutase [Microbacterium amylolyticum]MBP2436683.1 glutamate-1-semialdehyde 2,1-aminomutase [Microbacterium amylolyticum]
MTRNDELFDRARNVIPGGVNSPVRAFGSVGGTPLFLQSARGAYVTDADGREYVDLVASWGPALIGHTHPQVVDAVKAAAEKGLSFGAPTEGEVQLAGVIADRVQAAGLSPVEEVRLVSTGTEATMTAIRLARGVTGRDLLVKFDGNYHGHSDGLLAAAGSGVATLALPGTAGVPAGVAAETLVVPYGDLEAVREVIAAYGDRIAAIIVEGAPANMGVVEPPYGFNADLAEMAHGAGALLILDEVLTGFRVHRAGAWGLQVENGPAYEPDIITFGKVVGGGMPLAALGGKRAIMEHLAPTGPVYQAGTLSGNPLSVAAGLATLELATDEVYAHINAAADTVTSALTSALAAEGVVHAIPRVGSLFGLAFFDRAPANYEIAKMQEAHRYPPFFHAMLAGGVNLPPSVYEAWFLTAAHDDEALGRIVDVLPAAAKAAASAAA